MSVPERVRVGKMAAIYDPDPLEDCQTRAYSDLRGSMSVGAASASAWINEVGSRRYLDPMLWGYAPYSLRCEACV